MVLRLAFVLAVAVDLNASCCHRPQTALAANITLTRLTLTYPATPSFWDPPISSRPGCSSACNRPAIGQQSPPPPFVVLDHPYRPYLLWLVVRPVPLSLATNRIPFSAHRSDITRLPRVVRRQCTSCLSVAIGSRLDAVSAAPFAR